MSNTIKLYLDEDAINTSLIQGLRSRSIDVLTVTEAGLQQATDTVQLNYAASVGRVLFTFNTKDYAQLHLVWLTTNQHHAGIVVSDQLSVSVLLRRLLRLNSSLSAEDMRDRLEFLSNWR